jgi:hypothetical protein
MHWHAYQRVGAGADRGKEVGATFGEVWLAVVWLAGAYGRMRVELPLPGVLLEERLEAALDLLPRGVDVRWREWLSGGRFVTIGVACCPNRQVPWPCPMRHSSSERAAGVPALTSGSTWEVGP